MRPGARLAERLGLPIRDLDRFELALVHSSYYHEHPTEALAHNERLEFLGDAVIGLAVSQALYGRHPSDDEGRLSERRAAVVSASGLAGVARRIGLGDELLLGEGEGSRGGRTRESLLASAFEALAGAIYIDLGFDAARDWILQVAEDEIGADLEPGELKSPKSTLQELTQKSGGIRPHYRLVESSGPDHDRRFVVEAVLGDRVLGRGNGPSRRVAETEAATRALELLERESAGSEA